MLYIDLLSHYYYYFFAQLANKLIDCWSGAIIYGAIIYRAVCVCALVSFRALLPDDTLRSTWGGVTSKPSTVKTVSRTKNRFGMDTPLALSLIDGRLS